MSMTRSDFFRSLCATVLAFFGLRKPEPEVAGTKAWKYADGDKFIFKTTANTADPIEPGVVRDRLAELDEDYADGEDDVVTFVSVPGAPIELTIREPVTVSSATYTWRHDPFGPWSTG